MQKLYPTILLSPTSNFSNLIRIYINLRLIFLNLMLSFSSSMLTKKKFKYLSLTVMRCELHQSVCQTFSPYMIHVNHVFLFTIPGTCLHFSSFNTWFSHYMFILHLPQISLYIYLHHVWTI